MIYLGADHAGFELKEAIAKYLKENGKEVEDLGAFEFDQDDDYPDFVRPVAKAVAQDPEHNCAIVLGGSGQGEAMVANRVRGVRAAVYYGGSLDIIKLSRAHNDANVLALGGRFLTKEEAFEAVRLWLGTPFEGGRHSRRVQNIDPTP